MNKISLLTLSVAIALSGCGSDSADNSEQPPIAAGVLITALDGHFYQAVIFDDANKNGKFDNNEHVLGLTNQSGQLKLPADYQLKGHLAVQTLTPGGAVQRRLANLNAAYAGKYTIDMDHPAQAMAHEVVFRAPTLEAQQQVISPITDLIVLAMENDPISDLTQAKQTVANTLGLDDQAELLSDFTKSNPKLHKKAQILTDSKAANPASYEKNAAQFAEKSAQLVGNMDDTEIKDVNQRPVIINDNENTESGFAPKVVTNHKLQVSKEVKGKLEADFAQLNLKEGDTPADQAFSIAKLFSDKDQPTVEVTLEQNLVGSGLSAEIIDQQLVLSSNGEIKAQDNLYLILVATDKDNQGIKRGEVRVQLNLKVTALNQAPVINQAEKETLQQQIDAWYLQQGEAFDQSINISALFNDTDGQVVSYWGGEVQVAGLTIADVDSPMITLSGTPSQASPAGQTFTVKVKDDQGAESSTTFILPEVKEGIAPPSLKHPLEATTWYRLEHGGGTATTKLPYDRIWCDTLHFENGKISGNHRTMDNLTQCGDLDNRSWYNGTYQVQGEKLIASFGQEKATLTITDADDIAPGAKTLTWSSDEGTERYTLFHRKSDAEARIQIKSNDGPEKRFFPMMLPTQQEGVEALGMVSLSLLRNNNPDDIGAMDANLTLEFPDQNFTCQNAEEFYKYFIIHGPQLVTETTDYNTGKVYKSYGVYSGNEWGTSLECHEKTANHIEHASIDFDLPELTIGSVYSFIGRVKNHQGQYIEAIKFNVTWTGTGDNE
ncbi:Ig domain-containing protein [Vibrio metschnikovii]|uniref:Ig domain-containing protein n=1 Tax=Vibrio metschnikovii TaxID=28172 RepID=UPI001C2FF616|nr:Ig domain-containing protein [Vibrio metschnikovii]